MSIARIDDLPKISNEFRTLQNVLNERETVEKMKENAQVHVLAAACDPDP